jgi:nitroreductase
MEKKFVGIILCTVLLIMPLVPARTTFDLEHIGYDNSQDWIVLPNPIPVAMLLEQSICRRMSFHTGYPSTPVSDEDLSTVLWAAYGVTSTGGRTVYSPNGTYSTTIYVIRSDATYTYVAANHSLRLWKTGNYLYIGQDTDAPIKFGLVWNQSIASDEKAAMMEIGMIAQNVYFDANALNLATITTGMSVNELYDLDLPSNEKPEIIMHLGYPPASYDFTYDPLPMQNLPLVINNTMTLADTVTNRSIVSKWADVALPLLDQSQTVWCSYGSSYLWDNIFNTRHRTLPSAVNIYPFKIYAANQTGVYKYNPTSHSISLIVSGDKRTLIQNAVAHGNIDISSAPWIIIPFWDKNVGSQSYITWWWYETGAIIHNVLLEATARNLTSNVVTVITDQNALRSALGLSGQTNLVPEAAIMVGHPFGGGEDTTPPVTICTLNGTQQGSAYISPVEVALMATDDYSGVNFTKYKVDMGDWTTYSTPFMVSGEGEHTVFFYSVDTAGNIETQKNTSFTIRYFNITAINGGFGVSAVIENIGTTDQIQVPWTINFSGGITIPKSSGSSVSIGAGESATVTAKVFGFGRPTITVTIGTESKSAKGILLFFFVIGVK